MFNGPDVRYLALYHEGEAVPGGPRVSAPGSKAVLRRCDAATARRRRLTLPESNVRTGLRVPVRTPGATVGR